MSFTQNLPPALCSHYRPIGWFAVFQQVPGLHAPICMSVSSSGESCVDHLPFSIDDSPILPAISTRASERPGDLSSTE